MKPKKEKIDWKFYDEWSKTEQVGYNQACGDWEVHLPSVEEIKQILLAADLEFNKIACVDDDFNEWLYALATAVDKRLRGE